MRHYVPQKKNPCALSHNLYMQMLYLIRDYDESRHGGKHSASGERLWQWQAVEKAKEILQTEYKKRPDRVGAFDPLQAFFDYAYFSCMFATKGREMGAGKRSWNLYRSRYAYLVAEQLGLFSASDNHHGQ